MSYFNLNKAVENSKHKPPAPYSSTGAGGGSFFTSTTHGPFSGGRGRGRGVSNMPLAIEEPRLYHAELTEEEAHKLARDRSMKSAGSSSMASYRPDPYSASYGQELDPYQTQAVGPRGVNPDEVLTVGTFRKVMHQFETFQARQVDAKIAREAGALRGEMFAGLDKVTKDAEEAAKKNAERHDAAEETLKDTTQKLTGSIVAAHNYSKEVAKESKNDSLGLKQLIDLHATKIQETSDKQSMLGKRAADVETGLAELQSMIFGGAPGSAGPPSPPPAPPAAGGRGRGGAGAKKKK